MGSTPLAVYTNSSTYYYHGDQVGSMRELTDPNKSGVGTCKALPFGDGQTCTTSLSSLYFGGQLWESESNLMSFLYRRYSTTQGRWTTPDPAGMAAVSLTNPQTWNQYAYVINSPVTLADLTCSPDSEQVRV